jgi:hypothetical protein
MKTKLGNIIIAVFLASTIFVAAGCSDDDETILNPAAGSQKTPAVENLAYGETSGYATLDNGAMLRAVHASPDAPPVDVYVEGESGSYTVELRAAGADAKSAPDYSADVTIDENDTITAVAAGLLGSSNDLENLRILPLVENFRDPGAGRAAVRIVHASADAPTVSIDVDDNGSADVTDLERFAATNELGVPLPSGTKLQIGILAGATRVTAFTTPELPEGAELFVIATGLLFSKLPREMDGFSLLAVGPTGSIGFIKQNPTVFALHGSPDAPPVDIYAGSAKLVDNLAFGALSEAIQVPPGVYALDFKATGSDVTSASATTPSLAAGERYLAIASGFLSNGQPDFRLLPFGDSFADAGMDARVRVVHASPDAPPVDVGTVSDNNGTREVDALPEFTDLEFEEASTTSGTTLPVGSLPIGIAEAGTTAPVKEFTVPTRAGLRAFAVAAGSLTPEEDEEAFRLLIVDATDFPWTALQVLPN